jgi:hypothetical protein
MTESGKRAAAVFVFLAFVTIGVFVFFYFQDEPEEPAAESVEAMPAAPDAGVPPAEPELPVEEAAPARPVMEKPTDAQIREWAEMLSVDQVFTRWVQTQHLLGKFVAVVENISTGQSPRKLLGFMEPEGKFKTLIRGEREFLDPESYRRYDVVANAFASLDAQKCARLVNRMYPWLDRKYREMGKPGLDFRGALAKAIAELLRVPVVTGDIPLQGKAVSMEIAIEELEAMSDAQKHLFRMGPENIRKIQAKLREVGRALGMSTELDQVQPIPHSH